MADEVFVLSEVDLKVLRQLIDSTKKSIVNYRGGISGRDSWSNTLQHLTDSRSDIYIVKTPVAGISAFSPVTLIPPYAECEVYNIVPSSVGSSVFLQDVANFPVKVHNTYLSALPGNTYILAVKDKYGSWFALSMVCCDAGTGTGTGTGSGITCDGCTNTPDTVTVTISGVTDNFCFSCSLLNTTHVLTRTSSCHWQLDLGDTICGVGSSVILAFEWNGSEWTFGMTGDPYIYAATTWVCPSTLVMTRTAVSTLSCSSWPATLSVS